ncbi:MAG: hypothetical protein PHX27_03155, partial [Candidatus ainarchaeum sp.]|nr:hypothetical protein [Candidatus ainarchaeum sp.]
ECFYPDTKSIVRKSRIASINKIKNGVMPPHQGAFVKKKWLQKHPFSLNYKSSADFDFFCNLLKENIKIKKIDKVIAQMTMGGISSNNISYIETEKVVLKNFGYFYYYKLFLKNRFFIFTRYFLKKTKLISMWRKINNKLNIN